MTLTPPPHHQPNPLLYPTTPSDTYTPAGNNFTPSLNPLLPTTTTFSAHIRTPFLPQPHQLHSAHLIRRGEDREKEKGGGSVYLRWLSSVLRPSKAAFCLLLLLYYCCNLCMWVCTTGILPLQVWRSESLNKPTILDFFPPFFLPWQVLLEKIIKTTSLIQPTLWFLKCCIWNSSHPKMCCSVQFSSPLSQSHKTHYHQEQQQQKQQCNSSGVVNIHHII